jgi:hypothetical protein
MAAVVLAAAAVWMMLWRASEDGWIGVLLLLVVWGLGCWSFLLGRFAREQRSIFIKYRIE